MTGIYPFGGERRIWSGRHGRVLQSMNSRPCLFRDHELLARQYWLRMGVEMDVLVYKEEWKGIELA